jgi:hypothetical protein
MIRIDLFLEKNNIKRYMVVACYRILHFFNEFIFLKNKAAVLKLKVLPTQKNIYIYIKIKN